MNKTLRINYSSQKQNTTETEENNINGLSQQIKSQ